MSRPRKVPHSARVLTQWVDAYARERGLGRKRVRDWVSYMVVGGQLERASSAAEGPRFTIKGAVALEMRLPTKARATRDIDLVVDDAEGRDVARILDDALAGSYQDFTFRVKGEPHLMPNGSVRLDVVLHYRGKNWGTIQVDVSRREGAATEVELVPPLALEPFGLDTPPALPCLSLRYHVAQKIHGMTQPPRGDDVPNERFRDLVDLLLMRELAHDMSGIREACVEVFALRGTHTWPPSFEPPAFWAEPFGRLAADVGLAAKTLAQAAAEAQAFINRIDAAPSP